MKIRIHDGGSALHANIRAQILGTKVYKRTGPCDRALFYSAPVADNFEALYWYIKRNIPIFIYWCGSDVLRLLNNYWYRTNFPKECVHLCIHNRLKEELKLCGINAQVINPPATIPCKEIVPAKQKAFGVYMPPRTDTYCPDVIKKLQADFPEQKFFFYGNTLRYHPYHVDEMYAQFSCLLRITKHDGFPASIIEAIQRGRKVICNYPYPGVIHAPTWETIKEAFLDPTIHDQNVPEIIEHYKTQYTDEKFRKNMMKVLR